MTPRALRRRWTGRNLCCCHGFLPAGESDEFHRYQPLLAYFMSWVRWITHESGCGLGARVLFFFFFSLLVSRNTAGGRYFPITVVGTFDGPHRHLPLLLLLSGHVCAGMNRWLRGWAVSPGAEHCCWCDELYGWSFSVELVSHMSFDVVCRSLTMRRATSWTCSVSPDTMRTTWIKSSSLMDLLWTGRTKLNRFGSTTTFLGIKKNI